MAGWTHTHADFGIEEYTAPSGHHYYLAWRPGDPDGTYAATFVTGRWDWNDTARTMRFIAERTTEAKALAAIQAYENGEWITAE
jgi:hypothetical protein